MCQGLRMNPCFSATQWTFLFETAAKCAVRYVKMVSHKKGTEVHIFMRPGWNFSKGEAMIYNMVY